MFEHYNSVQSLLRDADNIADVLERKATEIRKHRARIAEVAVTASGEHAAAIMCSVINSASGEIAGEVVHCSNVHLQSLVHDANKACVSVITGDEYR